jgi:hypothetical protein
MLFPACSDDAQVNRLDRAAVLTKPVWSTLMPQYFFTIRRSEAEVGCANGTMLPNDAAAISYAEDIIATMQRETVSGDLSIIVKNEAHEPILFIPSLPACA